MVLGIRSDQEHRGGYICFQHELEVRLVLCSTRQRLSNTPVLVS